MLSPDPRTAWRLRQWDLTGSRYISECPGSKVLIAVTGKIPLGKRVVGAAVEAASAGDGRSRAARPAARATPDVGAAPAHPGRADRGATGSHLGRAEGRARHAGQSGDDLARGGGSGRDRQKKRSGPPNTIDLTSRPRGSCGTPPRRPGIVGVPLEPGVGGMGGEYDIDAEGVDGGGPDPIGDGVVADGAGAVDAASPAGVCGVKAFGDLLGEGPGIGPAGGVVADLGGDLARHRPHRRHLDPARRSARRGRFITPRL